MSDNPRKFFEYVISEILFKRIHGKKDSRSSWQTYGSEINITLVFNPSFNISVVLNDG